MKPWQHLVVAVADPFLRQQMAIKKAAAIATRCNARITLFHAFSLPYPLPNPQPRSGAEALQAAGENRRKGLERLAKPLRKAGLLVDCVTVWDFPAHEAIVRQVLKQKPDLLVAESHRHGKVARWLLANTDWELIRACPCPLWFVKTPKLPAHVSLLAAVDPLHAHAKPAQLDERIVEQAQSLAGLMGGELSLAHAYTAPLSSAGGTFIEPLRVPISPDKTRRFVESLTDQVRQLAKRHGIESDRCLIVEGDPVTVIDALVQKKKFNVAVMGAVSRSGMKRTFIGSTAERLIDRLRCDLLIVKPAGFKPAIPRQSAASRLHI